MISVIAHRGASAVRPENTLEAFAEAARLGADGVELDVRRSADGALVVRHDPALPDGRVVANVQVADLPDDIPLLAAAVDACGDMVVNIEIKNLPHEPGWDPDEVVAAEVAAFAAGSDRFVVSSFSVATLDAMRRAEPSVPTGLLTLAAFDQYAAITTVVEHGHTAFHPHHEGLSAGVVAAAHDAGLVVTTWTVDDPDRLRAVADMGVDAVITNHPEVALLVLR
ncbi:MAG TPA: glycerophosphodiester phosphodiesterase [Acidimicrobiales bacterium]|nr:glycerophosphodiester phosphodiesterase [Acidimicrobiales bacterium]